MSTTIGTLVMHSIEDLAEKYQITQESSLVVSFAAILMAVTGLVHAAPMNVTPAGNGAVRAWSVPYSPVSGGMLTGLQGFLRTETGAGLLAQVPTLGIIVHMSPDSEVHRQIIGAMALPAALETNLQAALQTSDNKALAGALVTILSAYHSQNAEGKIGEAVQARAEEIATAVSQGKMSVAELSAAASELAPFTSISEKAKAVGDMASMARATNTMDAAKRIASTFGQNKGTAASDQDQTAVAEPASSEGTTTADRKTAKDLLWELGSVGNISYSKAIVGQLRTMAENKQEEGLQRLIVRGLSKEFQNVSNIAYSQYVINALEGVADKTTFANIQVMIVQAIMDDVSQVGNISYSKKAIDSVERIARRSSSQEVKDLAISSMMAEVKRNGNVNYSKFILAKIESVQNSWGKTETIPLPATSQQKQAVVAGWKGLINQVSEGVSNHPVGAFFALLALASTAATLGIAHFPIIGIAGVVAALLFVATKGLWTDHPVAGFFQLLVIGALFEAVAKAGLMLAVGPVAWLIAAGVLGAGVALWSFKKDRPVLGFFLNLVLMWMFQAVIMDSTAMSPLFLGLLGP